MCVKVAAHIFLHKLLVLLLFQSFLPLCQSLLEFCLLKSLPFGLSPPAQQMAPRSADKSKIRHYREQSEVEVRYIGSSNTADKLAIGLLGCTCIPPYTPVNKNKHIAHEAPPLIGCNKYPAYSSCL